MLLELRFLVFRTFGGCRVGRITDAQRTVDGRPVHVWGWPYQTLEGHIEQGEMSWEVWEWPDTGEVQFRVHSYSRMVGGKNPFTLIMVSRRRNNVQTRHVLNAQTQRQAHHCTEVPRVPAHAAYVGRC